MKKDDWIALAQLAAMLIGGGLVVYIFAAGLAVTGIGQLIEDLVLYAILGVLAFCVVLLIFNALRGGKP